MTPHVRWLILAVLLAAFGFAEHLFLADPSGLRFWVALALGILFVLGWAFAWPWGRGTDGADEPAEWERAA